MMSFYFTTVGYYFCTMLTVLTVYIFLYGKAYLLRENVAKHDMESLKVLKLLKSDARVPTYLVTFEAPLLAETKRKNVKKIEICMPTLFPTTTIELKSEARVIIGDLPVVISCASLALADVGIMLYDLISAVSVSCLGKNLVIDPVSEEESYQEGGLMITSMVSRNEITQLAITGEWSTLKLNEAMELCLVACSKLGEVMSACLKQSSSTSQE